MTTNKKIPGQDESVISTGTTTKTESDQETTTNFTKVGTDDTNILVGKIDGQTNDGNSIGGISVSAKSGSNEAQLTSQNETDDQGNTTSQQLQVKAGNDKTEFHGSAKIINNESTKSISAQGALLKGSEDFKAGETKGFTVSAIDIPEEGFIRLEATYDNGFTAKVEKEVGEEVFAFLF